MLLESPLPGGLDIVDDDGKIVMVLSGRMSDVVSEVAMPISELRSNEVGEVARVEYSRLKLDVVGDVAIVASSLTIDVVGLVEGMVITGVG